MDRLGKLIREKRSKRNESLKELARVLKCAEGTAKHLETAPHVAVSKRLFEGLKKHYRFPNSSLEKAAAARNKFARAYRKAA